MQTPFSPGVPPVSSSASQQQLPFVDPALAAATISAGSESFSLDEFTVRVDNLSVDEAGLRDKFAAAGTIVGVSLVQPRCVFSSSSVLLRQQHPL